MAMKPTTRWGRLAVALVVAFGCLLGVFFLLVASGQRGGRTFFSNLWLTLPMLLAAACGIGAFFVGAASIIRARERSVFVFLATGVGLFVLLFAVGEIVFPH